ncbi:MAG: cytochrome c biogenesis protein ResB [Candidatus Hydrogenedens sp.]|jgi:hypothetical protein|nr:cytochrome c biogenesis protein ResB [Candidatus Hydrogenedens sp.]
MNILKAFLKFTASYGLATLLLLLLLLLVFFGTLEQGRIGLFAAQEKYFSSLFLIHYLGGLVPIPLPGGYLLLALLFINVLVGGMLRAPKKLGRPGLLIVHGGILYLVLAGFVSHHYAISGNMPLFEGSSSHYFQSYFDWNLVITEVGEKSTGRQYVIPQEWMYEPGTTLHGKDLPFSLEIERYYKNAMPQEDNTSQSTDGVSLSYLPENASAEMNVPGLVISLKGGSTEKAVLWGMQRLPWLTEVEGRQYAFDFTRQRWELPFSIALEKFNHEWHPGTNTPSHFSSRVSLTDGGLPREALIQMNEPLRHGGYTFYQASWGPPDGTAEDALYSVLAVVKNPAGNWPVYASCVISLGLLIHYLQVLLKHLKRRSRIAA